MWRLATGAAQSPARDDAKTAELRVWGLFRLKAGDDVEPLLPGSKLKDRVLLYVHGWQPGHNASAFDPDAAGRCSTTAVATNVPSFPACPKEGFLTPDIEEYGDRFDTAQPWRNAGYDVLCFCWAPISDEATPKEAEKKVWAEQTHVQWKCPGCKGCEGAGACGKWRLGKTARLSESEENCTIGYRSCSMPEGGLGKAFCNAWEELVTASGVKRPSYLHLVGHSLGTQLACNFLRQQLRVRGDAAQVVQRLTLLDPYFTNFKKAFLDGRWPGEVVREVVSSVSSSGAAVEQYKSSIVLNNPLSDMNTELTKQVAYYVLQPSYLPVAGGCGDIAVLGKRHSAAKYVYFRSKACPPAVEVAFKDPDGPWEPVEGSPGAGYAGASDRRIRELMAAAFYWQQIGGTDTSDPAAHTFEKKPHS